MRGVCVSLVLFTACAPALPQNGEEADLLGAAAAIPRAEPCGGTTSISFEPTGAQKLIDVAAVSITVIPSRTCRARNVSIELFTPKGSPFEVRALPVLGARGATFRFPVAGSAIAQRGLFGPWGVRAFVDGAALLPTGFDLDR